MSDERELLRRTAEIAADFVESLDERPVWPSASVEELREALGGPLPDGPSDPRSVIEDLAEAAGKGVVAIPSGRYFGFVIGGSVPAALAADWLASTWDQNAGLYACGPSAAVVEEVVGEWLKDLLGIPATASFALVTGCQMAHATCLAAARNDVLARVGWDVERDGLPGSPPIRVVAGRERHATIDRALRLLGLGTASIVEVRADDRAAWTSSALRAVLAELDGPTIVCAQLGEVNTGSFDPIAEIADLAHDRQAPGSTSTAHSACGRRQPRAPAPRCRGRARRLVGDRCAQVAQRALRLRHRVRRATRKHTGPR